MAIHLGPGQQADIEPALLQHRKHPRHELTMAVLATTDGLPVESGGIGGSASIAPDS